VSSNNYQIYINKTLRLAQTIVIKSSYTAQALNSWVVTQNAIKTGAVTPVDADPKTWKYYLNLSGEYHPIDQVMTVVSMDTLDEIIFNKENLRIHTATARAYQHGTAQYAKLVAKYPTQEQLILGILYPADIDYAIAADDAAILTYPPDLVEANEYSLITNLQRWITHFKDRWYIPGFDITDDLYGASVLGTMYLLLPQAILNARLAACNTNEAHSFHVQQYLGSHAFLDSYLDSLTTEQALYFYRNINYIERHAGKSSTFDKLTEHIMTKRAIPIAEYTMKHDVTDQATNIYPEVIFRKKQLNLGITLAKDNVTSLAQLLTKEEPLAPGNPDNYEEANSTLTTLLENSKSNVVVTKVLESSMVDESNSSPWILSEILFNHWLWFASKGLYTAYVAINNPRTGEKIPLTAKEAFVLAIYAFSKSRSIDMATVPLAYASRVQRMPMATVDDIYSIVDSKLLDRHTAEVALAKQPTPASMISIDAFYNVCVKINDAMQMQRRLIAFQEHHKRRGQVQAMVGRIYCDSLVELEPDGTLYSGWLSDRNIDLSQFSPNDFELMFNDIVGQATGQSLHPTQSLKELQRNMVDMFTKLSSYPLQVVREINDDAIRKADNPYVRLGDTKGTLKSSPKIPDATVSVDRVGQGTKGRVQIKLNHPGVDPNIHQKTRHRVKFDPTLQNIATTKPIVFAHRVQLPAVHARSKIDPSIHVPRGWSPFLGIEYFLNLTSDQKEAIIEYFVGGNKPANQVGKIPLNQVVIITELLPFDLGDRAEPISYSVINTLLGKIYPPTN
jgi:hypothetical protein